MLPSTDPIVKLIRAVDGLDGVNRRVIADAKECLADIHRMGGVTVSEQKKAAEEAKAGT